MRYCRAQPIAAAIRAARVLRTLPCPLWVVTIVLGMACGVASAQQIAHPTPKFAYVANEQGANVSAYTINISTGALRPSRVRRSRRGKNLYL